MGGGQENYVEAFKPQDWVTRLRSFGILDSKDKVLVSRVPLDNSREVITTYMMIKTVQASNVRFKSHRIVMKPRQQRTMLFKLQIAIESDDAAIGCHKTN